MALKHSEGIKHKVLLQKQEAYNNTKAYNTHPLSLFLVFLSKLSTQNNLSLAPYLYMNSEQENSTFKYEGGWRPMVWMRLAAAARRWQLVACGWSVTAAGR